MKDFLKKMSTSEENHVVHQDEFALEFIDHAEKGMRPFYDLPWIATDSQGNIGIFISAGFGQIPMEIFNDKEKYFNSIPLIEKAITEKWHYTYDYVGQCQLVIEHPYELQNKPEKDMSLDLNEVTYAHFEDILFEDTDKIVIDDYFEQTNDN